MTEHEAAPEPPPEPEPESIAADVGEPREETPPAGQQSELDLGVVPTGDPRVDDALTTLEILPDTPVDEHPEVFEAVHQRLHEALSDVAEPSG